MISVTFCLAKSRHFYHILLYMFMCIFVCIFYINNTAKGNTSLMLNTVANPGGGARGPGPPPPLEMLKV